MPGRWLAVSILVFWLAMLGWFVAREVVPDLLIGAPPAAGDLVPEASLEPVRWTVLIGEEMIGQARTWVGVEPGGWRVLRTEVEFDELPPPLNLLAGDAELSLDSMSQLHIDPQGRVARFQFTLAAPGEAALLDARGSIVGDELRVRVENGSGLVLSELRLPRPQTALLGDPLGPNLQMRGLRAGQRWGSPLVNPISGEADMLISEVVRPSTVFFWDDEPVDVLLVETRRDNVVEGRTWVRREDGLVLRQEVRWLFSALTFARQPPDDAAVPLPGPSHDSL